MITWIQRFFLKHNKWLFGSLLVVIVVTFVLTIGPQSFFDGSSSRQQTKLPYFGFDLASPVDQQAISTNGEISAMINPEMRLRRDQLSDYSYIRIAGLGIARQMGIPEPTKDQLTDYVRSKEIFKDRESGEFSTATYNQILGFLESSNRFNKKTIARVLQEDYQIKQVRDALSGPLYVLPKEVESQYKSTNSEYSFSIVKRSFNDFEVDLEVSSEDAKAFYEENPARYEIPERLSATAVLFKADNFLDQVPEFSQETIESYFNKNKSKYQTQAEEGEEEAEPIVLETVSDKVIADMSKEAAISIAREKTEAFSVALWEQEVTRDSPKFNELVNEFGGNTLSIPPYDRNTLPSMPNISRQLFASLWSYTAGKRYFSEIGSNKDGAVVLTVDEVIPNRIPSYEEIETQVMADFREDERVRVFIAEGPLLKADLKNALANSEDPQVAVENMGLAYESIEAFTGEDVPNVLLNNDLWQQSRYLNDSELTNMIFTGNEGVFVYARSIVKPDMDKSSEEYQQFTEELKELDTTGMGWARLSEISAKTLDSLGLNP